MSNRALSYPKAAGTRNERSAVLTTSPVRATAGFVALAFWCLLMAAPAGAAPTPEQKCQSGKNVEAGKYAYCLQKAEAKYVKTGDATRYSTDVSKCETKFSTKWQKLIDAAANQGATCPDDPLTASQYMTVIDEHSDNVTTALGGGGLENCPPELSSCQSDLAACLGDTLPADRVLKTGQTSCYNTSGTGTGISCTGTGQDGDLKKGVVRSYTDNGDGTVTDNQTGLMWEKKSDDGSLHDKDDLYSWSNAFTVFIAGLNTASFAGHNDWRLPNRFELESLVNLGLANPAIDSEFNNNCVPGCLVATCSCTVSDFYYWSSTVVVPTPNFAWQVGFNSGGTNFGFIQFDTAAVRAVRDAP
jgi:hypothetical protein